MAHCIDVEVLVRMREISELDHIEILNLNEFS